MARQNVHAGVLPFLNYPPPPADLARDRVKHLVCLHDALHASVTGYRQRRLTKGSWLSVQAQIKMFMQPVEKNPPV